MADCFTARRPLGGEREPPLSPIPFPHLASRRVAVPGGVSTPSPLIRNSRSNRLANEEFQGTKLVLPSPPNENVKLVPLLKSLVAWRLLPNVSPCDLQTIEKGYRIQF